VTDLEHLQADLRRLRAENAGLREELENVKARLGYALHQAVELRARIPSTVTQAAAPGSGIRREKDPLARFMEALRP
jgi:regulator of replication initiation timing